MIWRIELNPPTPPPPFSSRNSEVSSDRKGWNKNIWTSEYQPQESRKDSQHPSVVPRIIKGVSKNRQESSGRCNYNRDSVSSMTSSANQVEPLWKSGRENQKIRQKNIDILHADGMRAFQNKNKQTNNSNKLRRSGGTGVRRGGGAARGGKPQKGSKKPSIDPTNLKRVQVAQRNKKEEIRKKKKSDSKDEENRRNRRKQKRNEKLMKREGERKRKREREREKGKAQKQMIATNKDSFGMSSQKEKNEGKEWHGDVIISQNRK